MAKVVEYRTYGGARGVSTAVRFVLPAGTSQVSLVAVAPHGLEMWNVLCPGGRIMVAANETVGVEGGERFLESLQLNYSGSSAWATAVFDMADADAMNPAISAPDLRAHPNPSVRVLE